MKIAVEGCCHGELDKIYETLQHLEKKEGIKVDLLLCCGDFQAVRNKTDLDCMAVPSNYRKMQTFYKYYSGEKKAPVLTIFIGGNHEASNHLWELPYGGWVAPDIYYLGYAGVVKFGRIRIAGLSGIFKSHDYHRGHFESPPYDNSTMRGAYHIRSMDVFNLKLLSQPVDIFLSHDWPRGVYHYGNLEELYRYKSFLKDEIEANTLGSPPAGELLESIQPSYWFAAHLHTKFSALVPHGDTGEVKFTKFLALDKCLPRHNFLQVIDFGPVEGPMELSYDAEWMAIIKLTHELTNVTRNYTVLPTSLENIDKYKPDERAVTEVVKLVGGNLLIPNNFVQTVTPYDPSQPKKMAALPKPLSNPQTEHFCKCLGIKNLYIPEPEISDIPTSNPDEISLDDGDGDEVEEAVVGNPDEIDLDDDKDDAKESGNQGSILNQGFKLSLPPPRNEADNHPRNEADNHPRNEADNHPRNEADNHPRNDADNRPRNEADNHPRNEADNHPRNDADNHPRNEADNHPRNDADNHPRTETEPLHLSNKSGEGNVSFEAKPPTDCEYSQGGGQKNGGGEKSTEPKKKILKLIRRNQAIYESEQDEEQ